jgi:hypothetical protein
MCIRQVGMSLTVSGCLITMAFNTGSKHKKKDLRMSRFFEEMVELNLRRFSYKSISPLILSIIIVRVLLLPSQRVRILFWVHLFSPAPICLRPPPLISTRSHFCFGITLIHHPGAPEVTTVDIETLICSCHIAMLTKVGQAIGF